jgi:hypothetical protein
MERHKIFSCSWPVKKDIQFRKEFRNFGSNVSFSMGNSEMVWWDAQFQERLTFGLGWYRTTRHANYGWKRGTDVLHPVTLLGQLTLGMPLNTSW